MLAWRKSTSGGAHKVTFGPGAEPDVWHVQSYFCIKSILLDMKSGRNPSRLLFCAKKSFVFTL